MKIPFLAFISFLFTTALFAQNQDCVTAIEIMTKDSIEVSTLNGDGDVNDSFENDCIDSDDIESQSSWYTFTAFEAGTFNFTIKPNSPQDDLDFYLFRTQSGFCAGLESIRCNASSCLGTLGYTGIAPNDSDIFEDLNCEDGENSYSNEVELEAGEKYFLMVNNFTQNDGYTIVFCGTAKLGPDDTVCTNPILNNDIFSDKTYSVSPNPSSGMLHISDNEEIETIDVINIQGVVLEQIKHVKNDVYLNYPAGLYYLKLHLKDGKKAITPISLLD